MRKQGRHCPALGTLISSAQCGAERNSKIHCLPSCGFNPFGTEAYETFLQIEEKFTLKVLDYAISFFGRDEFRYFLEDATPKDAPREVVEACAPVEALSIAMAEGDEQGTVWEHWAREGWKELTNDECVLAQCFTRSYVTILEWQQAIDDHRSLCLDCLEPKAPAFLLFDRAFARLPRFERVLARVYPLQHFVRPIGIPIRIEHTGADELITNIEQWLAEDQRKDPELKTVKDWLFYNQVEAVEWLYGSARQRRDAILSNIDLHQCIATYRMDAPRAEIEGIFATKRAFVGEEPKERPPFGKPLAAFVWLRRDEAETETQDQGWPIVGTVRVYEDRVQVESMQKARFEFAKTEIARLFATRLALVDETVVDTAKLLRDNFNNRDDEPPEPSSLPPCHSLQFVRDDYSGDMLALFRCEDEFVEQPESGKSGPDGPLGVFMWERGKDQPPILVSMDQQSVLMLCMTEDCAKFARKRVPKLFKNALRFTAEIVGPPPVSGEEEPERDDAEAEAIDEEDEPVRPPLSEAEKQVLLRIHHEHYSQFLDDKIPWLDDHTPREAAHDPALRPKLVGLMKFHLNGLERRSRAEGIDYRIDGLLDELGLSELK